MTLKIQAWAESHPGQQRRDNEDGYLADIGLGLFAVCDGMGGHAAGEKASAEALKEIHRFLKHHAASPDGALERSSARPSPEERRKVLALLEQAVQSASSRLYSLAMADPRLRGMGTTATLLLHRQGWAYMAHVGDSRIYLLRGDQTVQLTEDHTVLAQLLRHSKMTPEAIHQMPYKHSLSRAVGTQTTVEVDLIELELCAGDRFVLCTDGLSEYLEGVDELAAIVQGPPAEAPQRLVAFANGKGGRDDITAMLLQVVEPEEARDGTQASQVEQHKLRMDTLGAIWLLKHLSYKELIQVLNITETRRYPPGARIVQEGDAGDCLFIVMRGQARVLKGKEQVALLGKGDHFGEMALVDQFPRSATVEAVTPVQVRTISREPFYELLRSNPLLSNKILWNFVQILSCRLRDTSQHMEALRRQLRPPDDGEKGQPSLPWS